MPREIITLQLGQCGNQSKCETAINRVHFRPGPTDFLLSVSLTDRVSLSPLALGLSRILKANFSCLF